MRLQIHNIGYADMGAVKVDGGNWINLDNATATIDQPGSSYGGIGGAYKTLSMTVPIDPALVTTTGTHTVSFKFNSTDGVSSAFRVLSFNLLTADGTPLLPASDFVQDDPNSWTPPLNTPSDIAAGKTLFQQGSSLVQYPGGPVITAACSDCHATDGRDLKYFNFSNESIITRSQFHGLTWTEGSQIASYIRNLSTPNPGQPWNPPYQPGPGLDSLPATSWSAGAGLQYALANDSDGFAYIPGGITASSLASSATLNLRELPIGLMLPDWNQWLPHVHPKDAWGAPFTSSAVWNSYVSPSSSLNIVMAQMGSASPPTRAKIQSVIEGWEGQNYNFYLPIAQSTTVVFTPALSQALYSTQLWQNVKSWELAQRYGLEGYAISPGAQEARLFPGSALFQSSPARIKIPSGPTGLVTSLITYEYLNNSWYELQLIANAGNRARSGNDPIDWPYYRGRVKDLSSNSGVGAGLRLTSIFVKGMQQGDNGIGPLQAAWGWAPKNIADISNLVSPGYASEWNGTPTATKAAALTAMLGAWLAKTSSYAPSDYYAAGMATATELPTANINGGKWEDTVYDSMPLMTSNGVPASVVNPVIAWGQTVWPAANWAAVTPH